MKAHRTEVVAPGQRPHGDEGRPDAGEVEHRVADVGDHPHVVGEDPAVVVVGGGDVVHLLTRVHRGGQPLGPVLAPTHRAAGDPGQEGYQALLAREVLLVPETPTHVRADHPDVGLGHAHHLRQHRAQLMRLLVAGHHRQAAGAEVERSLGAAAFEGHPLHPMVGDPLPQHVGGGGDDALHIGVSAGHGKEHIGAPLRIQQWRPCLHRRQRVDDDPERLVLDVDQLAGVLGHRPVDGHDGGDRIAHEPHPLTAEHPPLQGLDPGQGEVVAHGGGAGPGGGEVALCHHRDHTRQCAGGRGVDGTHDGVGHRAAEDGDVAQAGDIVIGQVPTSARHQPGVLPAQGPLAGHAPPADAAASVTAATMAA